MKALKKISIVIVSIIGVIIIYLAVVIFAPGFDVPKQPMHLSTKSVKSDEVPESRQDVSIKVNNTIIKAWLYLPKNLKSKIPCIVMSNGFGGTKGLILENYAQRYIKEGFAVIAYDYRHFGESEGEPRQMFSRRSQIEDLKAVISYARNRKEIDPNKIALWGTSGSGGYGLIVAASDKKITCIVGQCPSLDSHADGELIFEREGITHILRLFMHAQRDKGRSRFNLSAHKIPIVGKPGTFAMLTAPGAFEGYSKLVSSGFKNEVCARALLESQELNPIDYAKDVKVPVLFQISGKDNLVSQISYKKTAKILGKYADVRVYPVGHFDIYIGENFEKAVFDQITFFKKHFNH